MSSAPMAAASGTGYERPVTVDAVAHIDPVTCVNCGLCRDVCPVGAISEQQRVVCRICPACTLLPSMSYNQMEQLATKTACTVACPLGLSPQGYIGLLRNGRTKEAYRLIFEKVPLPGIIGRVCHHPCEQACKRGLLVDEPLAIRAIKRYVTDNFDYTPEPYPHTRDERVAVIGAGPAGLTAGHFLARRGFDVTVFDEAAKAGGMALRGIPRFRLPEEAIDADVDRLVRAGLTLRLGTRIGPAQARRIADDFDAVVVATGKPHSTELRIDGWRKDRVMTALDFMERVNAGQTVRNYPGQGSEFGGRVVVIGGGNVAIDTARTALRMGAASATAVCLETGTGLPCHPWDLDDARAEGVKVIEGWTPLRFTGVHNELTGVEFAKVATMERDDTGRLKVETVPHETMIVDADQAIVAIGQHADPIWSKVADGARVVLAGDVERTDCSVVDAMADGRRAALKVASVLEDHAIPDPMSHHELHEADPWQKIYPAVLPKTTRPTLPVLDARDRVHSFDEVAGGYSAADLDRELARCMQCGYEAVDPDTCIGCQMCAEVCPEGDVITMVAAGGEGEK